ncbi:LmbU family transcriptional regulator [Spirillospora sp. NPDC127200]
MKTHDRSPRQDGDHPSPAPPGPVRPGPRTTADRLGIGRGAVTRRTGLQLRDDMSFVAWKRLGRQLHLIADSAPWWLGDWLIYGETLFSDRYRQAIEGTGLDYQTLRNYAWVARRFPLSRRRDRLSFAHHAEVAALSDSEQDYWLDLAEKEGYSRNGLRRRIQAQRSAGSPRPVRGRAAVEAGPDGSPRPERGYGRAGGAGPESPESDRALRLRLTEQQEERWRAAAGRTHSEVEDWARSMLDLVARALLSAQAADIDRSDTEFITVRLRREASVRGTGPAGDTSP